ncbi:MAG: DUF4388 domain-containing protein [Acidobacteriota bacterium]
MSLVGSLEDLSLLDILQIVNVSRRSGVLRLTTPAVARAFVYFSGGNVLDIVGDFDEMVFLDFFEAHGLVDAEEIREARARGGGDPRGILKRLSDTGALNPRLLDQARRIELAGRLKLLTQQSSGEFSFALTEAGDTPGADAPQAFSPLAKAVSPQNLLTQTMAEASMADWLSGPTPHLPEKERAATPPPTKVPSTPTLKVEAPARVTAAASGAQIKPALRREEQPAERTALESSHAGRTSWAKNRAHVLLATDESIFKNLLRRRLLDRFAHVEAVGSLAEYLEACNHYLQDHQPFLALVDLLMPTQNGEGYLGGLEILEASSVRFPQVKVILMSDLEDEGILDVARSRGAAAIVPKPGLAHLRVDQFEKSLDGFSTELVSQIEKFLPPVEVEEEVVTFFRDLGAEAVSQGYRVRDQLGLLKGLMGELASPRESSEISLLVLRLAAEYFERAVLFLVKRDLIVGLGGFGETGDTEKMMEKVRRLKVPVGTASIFDAAAQQRSTVLRLQGAYTQADSDYAMALGAHKPQEMAAIPMVSRGRVIAVLYGDNALSGSPIEDLTGVEIFMTQAGLAMEKALLELQLHKMRHSMPKLGSE